MKRPTAETVAPSQTCLSGAGAWQGIGAPRSRGLCATLGVVSTLLLEKGAVALLFPPSMLFWARSLRDKIKETQRLRVLGGWNRPPHLEEEQGSVVRVCQDRFTDCQLCHRTRRRFPS